MRSDSANLNLLRAVAVLSVFSGHALQLHFNSSVWRELAHLGVLLFFVHTSLVLMYSLERQDQLGTERRWLRFIVRRVFRIYPLAIVAVLACAYFRIPCITGFQSLRVDDLSRGGLAANLALVQNLFGVRSVPCVLWSLPFEMQMYLVLPALYLLARRSAPAVFGLWLATIVAIVACLFLGLRLPAYRVLWYVPCFIPGVLAYAIGWKPKFPSWLWPLSLTVLMCLYLLGSGEWFACLLLGLAIPYFRDINAAWIARPAAFIAKYSFGIYLAHLAMFRLAFHGLGLPFLLGTTLAGCLTLATSVFLFDVIEHPLTDFGTRLAARLQESPVARIPTYRPEKMSG